MCVHVHTGAQSEPLRLLQALAPPPPPGAPRLIAAKPYCLSVRWDPPVGGVAVEGYRVEAMPECAGTPETHSFKTEDCRAELVGLRAGMTYKVRVMARNKSGLGEKGPVTVMRTEAVTPAPTNLQTQIVGGENSLVAICSWDRPECNCGQMTFHVEVDDGGEGSADFKEVYVGTSAQYSHALATGKSYKFRVRAVSSLGSSAWSVIKGFSKAPSAVGMPEGVAVSLKPDGRTAALVWNPPLSSSVSAYQVRVNLQEGKKRRLDEGFEYTRNDLSPGQHRFQVRSLVNGKWSEWSREVMITILPANVLKASAPVQRAAAGVVAVGLEQRERDLVSVGGDSGQENEHGMWPGQQGMSLLHTHSPTLADHVARGMSINVPAVGAAGMCASGDAFSLGVGGAGGMSGGSAEQSSLYGASGLEQAVVESVFGVGVAGVNGQVPHVTLAQNSRSVYGNDMPALSMASEPMAAAPLRLTQDRFSREPDSGLSMGISARGGMGGGTGALGSLGYGVGGAMGPQPQHPAQIAPQIPPHAQHGFGGGVSAQLKHVSGGERGVGMPKLLGPGGLGGLMGEEEGDELMSSIPTGLLDEARSICSQSCCLCVRVRVCVCICVCACERARACVSCVFMREHAHVHGREGGAFYMSDCTTSLTYLRRDTTLAIGFWTTST
jgi:hypothetical protein